MPSDLCWIAAVSAAKETSRKVRKVREVLKTMRSLRLKILRRTYVRDPERFLATAEGVSGAERFAVRRLKSTVIEMASFQDAN